MAEALPIREDETLVKSGILHYRNSNHIIKKLKKRYAVLFADSATGKARLEIHETEKDFRIGTKSIMIPGSDVVCVKKPVRLHSDDKFGIIIATRDEQHYLASSYQDEITPWYEDSCSILLQQNSSKEQIMQDNDIYESFDDPITGFCVTAGVETRHKLNLDGGEKRLVVENGHITLATYEGIRIARWGIEHLRRFGYSTNEFHFEAGRKSNYGEGTFTFLTQQSKQIHGTVSKEKSLCKAYKSEDTSGPKAKPITGKISKEVDECEIPMTTGGNIYADPSELFVTKQGISVGAKQPPEKPARLHQAEKGPVSSFRPNTHTSTIGGVGSTSTLNSLRPIKSESTHGVFVGGSERKSVFFPAKDVLPNMAQKASSVSPNLGQKASNISPNLGHQKASSVSPNLGQKASNISPNLGHKTSNVSPNLGQKTSNVSPNLGQNTKAPAIYSEVELITDAWRTYGREEPSYEYIHSEGIYDNLKHLNQNAVAQPSEEPTYARLHQPSKPPGVLYENRPKTPLTKESWPTSPPPAKPAMKPATPMLCENLHHDTDNENNYATAANATDTLHIMENEPIYAVVDKNMKKKKH